MNNSAFRNPDSALVWLPDMDLNHDKQIQSLLCYRYTIGQAGASDRLRGFVAQSSRQTGLTEELNGVDARPHPGPRTVIPIPNRDRGEGEVAPISRKLDRHNCSRRLAVICAGKFTSTCIDRTASGRRIIPPLLSAFAFGFGAIASKRSEDGGERAGVRAVVKRCFFHKFHPLNLRFSRVSKNFPRAAE